MQGSKIGQKRPLSRFLLRPISIEFCMGRFYEKNWKCTQTDHQVSVLSFMEMRLKYVEKKFEGNSGLEKLLLKIFKCQF